MCGCWNRGDITNYRINRIVDCTTSVVTKNGTLGGEHRLQLGGTMTAEK